MMKKMIVLSLLFSFCVFGCFKRDYTVADVSKMAFTLGEVASGDTVTASIGPWFNTARIIQVSFSSTASKCVNLEFFQHGTWLIQDRLYFVSCADGFTKQWHDLNGTFYQDKDFTSKLHIKAKNCGLEKTKIDVAVFAVDGE